MALVSVDRLRGMPAGGLRGLLAGAPDTLAAPVSAPRSEPFYTLDALRGIAAISVLMAHAAGLFHPIWMRSSYLAVDLFFGLSGFVLAHAYRVRLRDGLSPGTFIKMRLIRMMPLYLLGTAISVVAAVSEHAVGHGGWDAGALARASVAAVFFFPLPPDAGAPNKFAYPLNIPAWSLFFELLVNFLYAATFRVMTLRRLVLLCVISLVALVLTAAHLGSLDFGAEWSTLWSAIPRVMYSFFAGTLLYHFVGHVRRPRLVNPWLLMAGLGFLFAVPRPPAFGWLFDVVAVAVVFPLLIACAATALPGTVAEKSLFGLLGATSYALYAIHVPILTATVTALENHRENPFLLAPFSGIAFLLAVILLSLLADRYYDGPIRRAATRRLARW